MSEDIGSIYKMLVLTSIRCGICRSLTVSRTHPTRIESISLQQVYFVFRFCKSHSVATVDTAKLHISVFIDKILS